MSVVGTVSYVCGIPAQRIEVRTLKRSTEKQGALMSKIPVFFCGC